jgi:hypothetical protein
MILRFFTKSKDIIRFILRFYIQCFVNSNAKTNNQLELPSKHIDGKSLHLTN